MKPNLVVYKIVLIPLNGEVNIHSGGLEGISVVVLLSLGNYGSRKPLGSLCCL